MADTKEKNVRLSFENLDKVSGGADNPGPWKPLESHNCEICGHSCFKDDDDNLVIPFQGGHLCIDCIKKVEERLGRKLL